MVARFWSGLACIAVLGCGPTISQQAREDLARPVECTEAERDIARLDAEKASVGKRIAAGVRSVFPAAAVAGILRRDLRNRAAVAAGAYNGELEAKIGEIRQQCHIPEGELTEEGLIKLRDAKVGFASLRPGVDLAQYRELILLPAIQGGARPSAERTEDLRRWFLEAFVAELQEKGGYRIVDDPAEGVLLLRPTLIDLGIREDPGTSAVLLSSTGQVSLVGEFRDALSGELVARVSDRQPAAGTDVREVFRRWARLLRERLDEAHELRELRQAS
jgi:hypothetical protein